MGGDDNASGAKEAVLEFVATAGDAEDDAIGQVGADFLRNGFV
jgi:hypothetical protein